jgi:hypothetical protein
MFYLYLCCDYITILTVLWNIQSKEAANFPPSMDTSSTLALKRKGSTIPADYFHIPSIQCLHTGDIKGDMPLKCRVNHLFLLPIHIHVLSATYTSSFNIIWINMDRLACQNFNFLPFSLHTILFMTMCTVSLTEAIPIVYMEFLRAHYLHLSFISLMIMSKFYKYIPLSRMA